MTWLRSPGPVAPGLKIGLLGGSFNPAHAGHLYVTEVARHRLGLDYVWWIVSPQNPLKPVAGMGPFDARMRTARIVAAHDRRIIVTDLERRLGSIYTRDTIRALCRRFPGVVFYWLMGSDNLEQFHRWRGWRQIAALVPVAVILRPGSVLAPLKARASKSFHPIVIDGRRNEMSATAIRAGIGGRQAGMLE